MRKLVLIFSITVLSANLLFANGWIFPTDPYDNGIKIKGIWVHTDNNKIIVYGYDNISYVRFHTGTNGEMTGEDKAILATLLSAKSSGNMVNLFTTGVDGYGNTVFIYAIATDK